MDMDSNNNSEHSSRSSEHNLSYHSQERETNIATTGNSLWKSLAPKYKDRLYNHILKTSEVKVVVNNWLNSYALSNDKAMEDLLQLFVDLASFQHINLHSYLEYHEITDIIPHMENSLSSVIKETGIYLLYNRQKSYQAKHLKIEDFLVVLIRTCAADNILYDYNMIVKCIKFLKEMGNSNVRAIRHTGVFIALKFQSGLIRHTAKLSKKMQQYRDQIEKESNENKACQMENKLMNSNTKYEQVNKMIDFLHKTIYAENWNMLDSKLYTMRQDCIAEILNWIVYFPERYLQNNCIVYVTKAVTDPNKMVRYSALKNLSVILQKYHVELQPKLSKYISTIADRIQDIDFKVAILAIDCLTQMTLFTKMSHTVRDIILQRVYAINYPLAAACGRFLIQNLKLNVENVNDDVEILKRLIHFQVSSNLEKKISGMYPMLIEAVIDDMPMLQDVNVYLTFLHTVEMDEDTKEVFINILTESVSQTYTGYSSIQRKDPRHGRVDKDKGAQLTRNLIAALPELTDLYSLDALKPLLIVIKQYRDQNKNTTTINNITVG